MTKYVAFLRGVGPSNPNMHGSKLKSAVESLGYKNVSSFISSGNVLFETDKNNISAIEGALEAVWPQKLGFKSMTIVKSQQQLKELVALDPYKGAMHSRQTYLLVTFPKVPLNISFKAPYQPPEQGFEIVYASKTAICSLVDVTTSNTPDLMSWLEKQFGKDITSRTWNTLVRVLKKME